LFSVPYEKIKIPHVGAIFFINFLLKKRAGNNNKKEEEEEKKFTRKENQCITNLVRGWALVRRRGRRGCSVGGMIS